MCKNVPSVGEAQVLRALAGDGPGRLLRSRGDCARPRQELVSGDNILSPGQRGPRHSGGFDLQSRGLWSFRPESRVRHGEHPPAEGGTISFKTYHTIFWGLTHKNGQN